MPQVPPPLPYRPSRPSPHTSCTVRAEERRRLRLHGTHGMLRDRSRCHRQSDPLGTLCGWLSSWCVPLAVASTDCFDTAFRVKGGSGFQGRRKLRSPGMAVGLRSASRLIRSQLQSRNVCASQDRATASVRRSGLTYMRPGQAAGRLLRGTKGSADLPKRRQLVCRVRYHHEVAAPSRLQHISETMFGRWPNSDRSRRRFSQVSQRRYTGAL